MERRSAGVATLLFFQVSRIYSISKICVNVSRSRTSKDRAVDVDRGDQKFQKKRRASGKVRRTSAVTRKQDSWHRENSFSFVLSNFLTTGQLQDKERIARATGAIKAIPKLIGVVRVRSTSCLRTGVCLALCLHPTKHSQAPTPSRFPRLCVGEKVCNLADDRTAPLSRNGGRLGLGRRLRGC